MPTLRSTLRRYGRRSANFTDGKMIRNERPQLRRNRLFLGGKIGVIMKVVDVMPTLRRRYDIIVDVIVQLVKCKYLQK